nr:FAD-binding domain-containing protein [Sodalis-like endosymbiont of Proechinophthirus fluctus]
MSAWQQNDDLFDAWCTGHNQLSHIDAAMRQLAETDWMRNWLRMISASFLVNDLLIDGDLTANNGG